MIVVRIELWPHGDETRKRELAIAVISNDVVRSLETEGEHGDYRVLVSHQAGTRYAQQAPTVRELLAGAGLWKRGVLRNFPRSLGAVHLVQRALTEALHR